MQRNLEDPKLVSTLRTIRNRYPLGLYLVTLESSLENSCPNAMVILFISDSDLKKNLMIPSCSRRIRKVALAQTRSRVARNDLKVISFSDSSNSWQPTTPHRRGYLGQVQRVMPLLQLCRLKISSNWSSSVLVGGILLGVVV